MQEVFISRGPRPSQKTPRNDPLCVLPEKNKVTSHTLRIRDTLVFSCSYTYFDPFWPLYVYMTDYFCHIEHSDYIYKPLASECFFCRQIKICELRIYESAGSYISKPPTKFNCSHNSQPPRNQVCLENPLLTAVCRAKVHKHFFGMQLGSAVLI